MLQKDGIRLYWNWFTAYATDCHLLDDILTVFQAQRHRLHFKMRASVKGFLLQLNCIVIGGHLVDNLTQIFGCNELRDANVVALLTQQCHGEDGVQ